MKLDLREPTIVIAGAFNPAIFEPSWVALNACGVEEGATVSSILVQDVLQGTSRVYIGSLALAVEPFRLTAFTDSFDQQQISDFEEALARVAQVLPHTPVAGVGVNFKFIVDQPEATVLDKLGTNEKLESIAAIQQFGLSTKFAPQGGFALTLSRTVEHDSLVLGFNYHSDLQKIEDLVDLLPGLILARCEQARALIENIYGIDEDVEYVKTLNA